MSGSVTQEKLAPPGFAKDFTVALAASVFLSFEYWGFGQLSWMYGYGAGLETIPVHKGLYETHSAFSFWAPFIAGGVDRLSFWGNADPFNLETLFIALSPIWLANGLHLFLQRLIAMYFTMRVCREQLGLEDHWVLFAGLTYGAFTYPVFGYMFAEAGVPLLLWLLPHLSQRSHAYLWASVVGLAFSTLTTFIWSQPVLPLFVLAWFGFVLRMRSARLYITAAVVLLFQALADAPQLFAMLANAPGSHRAGWALPEIIFSWQGLFYFQTHYDLFNQDPLLKKITIAAPIIAVVAGVVSTFIRNIEGGGQDLFRRLVLLYCILSAKFIWVGGQSLVGTIIPWVAGVDLGRIYQIPAPFLIGVLLTLSARLFTATVEHWWSKSAGLSVRSFQRIVVVVAAVFLLFMYIRPKIFLFYPVMIEDWGSKHYEVKALDELKSSDRERFRVASVLPLQPAYAYGQGFETADGWANLYPSVYRQLWLRVLDPLLQTLPGTRDVLDPARGHPQDHYIFLGLDLITPGIGQMPGEDTKKALKKGFDLDRRFNLDLLSMLNVKYLLSEYPLRGRGLEIIHAPDPWPARAVSRDYATGRINSPRLRLKREGLWKSGKVVLKDLEEAFQRKRNGKELFIYRNTAALPRYRLVSRLIVLRSDQEVLDYLARLSAQEMRRVAVTTVEALSSIGDVPAILTEGTVQESRYSPDEITVHVHSPGNSFLVIANTWNAAWEAQVDGMPRPLIRTNHSQFGLFIYRRDAEVRLRYRPAYASWVPFMGNDKGALFRD